MTNAERNEEWREDWVATVTGEKFLPEQLECRVNLSTPELRLWFAVLLNGIDALSSKNPIIAAEAREWIELRSTGTLSFAWACSLFGLDPAAVREATLGRRR